MATLVTMADGSKRYMDTKVYCIRNGRVITTYYARWSPGVGNTFVWNTLRYITISEVNEGKHTYTICKKID